ncbi:MAG: type II toxin-antitoxin system YafQ family toxin [Synergistaceae bacterium]|nr:type II toxin-antitoxin system YafQ family toxin [Synergistaceae bacterium]
MRRIEPKNVFKRDLKREMKGRYRLIVAGEMWEVVNTLANDISLDFIYSDHPLKGKWRGSRECHIAPDLLLVYRFEGDDILWLERLGSHSEIFDM